MRRRLRQLNLIPSRRYRQTSSLLGWIRPRALGLVVLSGMTSGCAHEVDDGPGEHSVTSKVQPVVGGTLSERESVILVRSQGPNGTNVCSGTLVAPNLVLTARHCVSAFMNGDYSCTIDGFIDLNRPRSPANAGDMGLPYPPENIEIFAGTVPDFDQSTTIGSAIIAPESDTICRNDIAFVLLEDELEFEHSPIRLDEGVAQNEPTTVVGFGINDNRRVERTERSDVIIEGIGFSEFYPVEGNALPRTFVVGRSVCPGDSGGPAFSDETGELLGVFSFFRGDCQSSEARNFFTQAAPFRSVALQAFEAAGYLELIEPEPEPPAPSGGSAPVDVDDDDDDENSPKRKGGCAYGEPPGKSRGALLWLLPFVALTYRRRWFHPC